jgi:hypothetical protein
MKGARIIWSKAEEGWLREHGALPAGELVAAFRARFGREEVSPVNLVAKRKRMGIRTGRNGRFEKGHPPQNKGCKMPFNARSAATQFKKGNLPHNTRYLGHERMTSDGYVEISVAETNPHTGYERRYVLKHRWAWEKVNGKLPPGMALKCLDGDKTNCDPANWEAVPRALLPRLAGGNRYRRVLAFDDAPPELKPAVLATAKLAHAAKTRRGA